MKGCGEVRASSLAKPCFSENSVLLFPSLGAHITPQLNLAGPCHSSGSFME